MLSRRLRFLGTAACAAVIFTMSAGAQGPDGIGASASAVEAPELTIEEMELLLLDSLTPIPSGVKIHKVIVTPGPEGSSVEFTGSIASDEFDTMACNNAPDSIYCNTAGPFLFGLGGTARWADDIVPTASVGCLIDRYVIRVTGDKQQDGSGTGGYRVDYALYTTCPGAETTPRVIPGTDGFMEVPALLAGDIIEIEHLVPTFTDARLDRIQIFLGIQFSRDKCGIVAGAKSLKGYSSDVLDLPGSACAARAVAGDNSLYAEIYARGECVESHVGFSNSKQSQSPNSAGTNKRLADDIVLAEDCMLVAYEVAFKDAVIEIDLRTALGGEDGPIIPGTFKQFRNTLGFGVEVAHVDVDPPFRLSAGFTYWLTAKSNSASNGIVQACRSPRVGESADLYQIFNTTSNSWEEQVGTSQCFGAFDVTIFCEGPPSPGACCDFVRGECLDGIEQGKPCSINAQCEDSTCESVCRDVPRINCTADELNVPLLWKENNTCGPVCTAGGALDKPCANQADCIACRDGQRDGELCCEGGTCGPPVCLQRSELTCSTDADCHVCEGGDTPGAACTGDSEDCPDGFCDLADTCGMVPTCISGIRNGLECCPDGSCPEGVCDGAFCVGGANSGDPCTREVDCPDGSCDGGPFGRSCGVAACCKPTENPEILGICENLTKNECFALPGSIRVFQTGKGCGVSGQRCPLSACVGRTRSCTVEAPSKCKGGMFDNQDCNFFAFPSECETNFAVGNYCGGNCVGGTRDGELCDHNDFFAPSCDGEDCQGCGDDPPDCPPFCGNQCPGGGVCEKAFCRGLLGCQSLFCCTDVCLTSNFFFCCDTHWSETCANLALDICERQVSANDECFGAIDNRPVQAQLLRIPDVFQADSIVATPEVPGSGSGPGFCCNKDNPGGHGVGSLWYKFIADNTSVKLSTCTTDTKVVNDANGNPVTYTGEDSMIAVYSVLDVSRGRCADQTPCDFLVPDCADGSECKFDEEFACGNLSPLACNDDDNSCDGGNEPKRSSLCVTGLIPGRPYYVQIAGKSNEMDPFDPDDPRDRRTVRGNGAWRVAISSPCSNDRPPMFNDACADGEVVTGGDVTTVVRNFDLSGSILGQCVGGSTPGAQCVVADNDCPGGGNPICRQQAPATFDCPGPPVSCLFNTMSNDIWYEWIAPATGEGLVDACGASDATTPDTGMVVYEGCECPADFRNIVDCSWLESSPCLAGAKVSFPVTEGTCYQVRLGGHVGGEPEGELKFSVNDFCGNGRFDSGRCVDGANNNETCSGDSDCPDGRCGEECDGGRGCVDCSCGDPVVTGYEKSLFPSSNCSAICGDGLVVEPEQCDGGLECSTLFCSCSFNSQPASPPAVDCVPLANCGNGQIDSPEQCDGGTGCGTFCTCDTGFEPDFPVTLDCVQTCQSFVSSTPACNGSLARTVNNCIELQFSGPLGAAQLATIKVFELVAGGLGAEVTAEFNIVPDGTGLVALTNDGVLLNQTWYGVISDDPSCGFELPFVTVLGDVNGDLTTNAFDVNDIWGNRGAASSVCDPYDINDDGTINAFDVNDAWGSRGSPPAKPSGHDCPEEP